MQMGQDASCGMERISYSDRDALTAWEYNMRGVAHRGDRDAPDQPRSSEEAFR